MYAFRMDIGKLDEKIGCSIFLILAIITMLPLSTGYIDCRISCRRCHENTEHPSVLEVYCAMCEECKQRRRERMAGRSLTTRTTAAQATSLVRMRDGYEDSGDTLTQQLISPPPPPALQQISQMQQLQVQQQPQQQQMQSQLQALQLPLPPMQQMLRQGSPPVAWPPGCPSPPPCSDSEEDPEKLRETAYPTTTTTTTTAPSTPMCPPIPPCRKRRRPFMPMMPCMPCMPMCPCPMFTLAPQDHVILNAPQTTTTRMDYHYVYVGIPKNALRS